MKTIQKSILLIAITLVFVTCSENDPGIVTPDEGSGAKTEIGLPIGVPAIQVIGASGGTVAATDGMMSIEIPAGALAADTPIIIQPITNFAPNGDGDAYQLSPEGMTFAKPVKLIFKSRDVISPTQPALTEIAFQGDDNVWYVTENITWDDPKGTVATETMHFSRWTIFNRLKIKNTDRKAEKVKNGRSIVGLNINESAEFKLILVEKVKTSKKDKDSELSALTIEKVVGEYVDYWMINGDKNGMTNTGQPSRYGKISVAGSDMACTYTAPDKIPARNPVDLSVHLKGVKYKDGRTGEIFDDLDVITPVKVIGFYDFDVEYLYHNPLMYGLAGDFTGYDTARMTIHINERGEVTADEFVNLNGNINPPILRINNCEFSWIAVKDIFPCITVHKIEGVVFSVGDGTTSQENLALSFIGDARSPEFKAKCDGNNKSVTVSSEIFQQNVALGSVVFALRDSAQTVLSDTKIFTAKLIPKI